MQDDKNRRPKEVQFTIHQLLIIQLWAEHARVSIIARKLNLSEHTVQTHLKRMRKKLQVRRTFDVYRYAREKGLIDG